MGVRKAWGSSKDPAKQRKLLMARATNYVWCDVSTRANLGLHGGEAVGRMLVPADEWGLAACDENTYAKRGWCRLEQWANATSGLSGMFIYGKKGVLEPADSHHVIKDSVFVYEGDFTVAADKTKIVDTVLGLWSICLETKGELLDLVNADRERAFPREYFGELPGLLEEMMKAEEADNEKEAMTKTMTKRPSMIRTSQAALADAELVAPSRLPPPDLGA